MPVRSEEDGCRLVGWQHAGEFVNKKRISMLRFASINESR